jgi:zinc transport system permease protein
MIWLLSAVAEPDWLERTVQRLLALFPHDPNGFFSIQATIFGLMAVILVSLICAGVGSLVVGNRMAFFSDALAHTAFAGISLGFLSAIFVGALDRGDFFDWATPIMVAFGVLVGLAIAYVSERTSLANDTIIGVFFAGAMGLGAMLLKGISQLGRYFNPEDFLFGSPGTINSRDLQVLFVLAVLTAVLLGLLYNQLLFTTFNPSLARSRRVQVRLCSYLFIALLAVIINVCLRTVGALLINALMIVPAATAANLSRNLRQMFWTTVVLSLAVGIAGYVLAYHLKVPLPSGKPLTFGSGGMIVVLSVVLFFGSLVLAARQRRRAATASAEPSEKAGLSS